MAFWFSFFFWLGTSIVNALLTRPRIENARPSGLDEFQVPTATEGRPVPVVVGKVRMAGPNVVWYGDLATEAIQEEVGGFLGIGAQDVTKGYRYFIGVQAAICRGQIDGVDRVWLGDKVIKSGESTGDHTVAINDSEFFGGEDRGGGIDFTLDFRTGSTTQAVHPYLATQQSPTPAYRNTCYCVLYDGSTGPGYIGDSAQLRNLAFEPFWYPNSLAVTGGKERIGDDANPLCFLYELLVNNTDWGLQISSGDVLLTGTAAEGALRTLAEQVADEGLGFSMVIDREMDAKDVIREIERHVDGAFRLDLTDGRFKIVLARPPIGAVPLLDESNVVEMRNFARANWADTKNELRVAYADRAKDYSAAYAFDFDNANRDIVGGRRNITTLNFPGIKTAATAAAVAARELVGFSFPLAKMQALVSRSLYTLQKGDAFDWSWSDYGISSLGMRVIKVSYDDDKSGDILVDAVEDVFRLQNTGFVDPPPSGFIAPNFSAAPPLAQRLWQVPAALSADASDRVATLASRDGGLHLSYDIYVDLTGGANFVLGNRTEDWTPSGQVVGAVDGTETDIASLTIDNVVDVTAARLTAWARSTLDLADPSNVVLVDDELMWFDGATDNMDGSFDLLNVRRAAVSSNAAPHLDNARIWFPTQGAGLIIPEPVAAPPQTISVKLTPRTATDVLDLASAVQLNITTVITTGWGLNWGEDWGGP